ncbi:MAG: carboxymuconolactone decarboxylase family protein [Deltaproteobacteria bacterium]
MSFSGFSNRNNEGEKNEELLPQIRESFQNFSKNVFTDGAIPGKTKQLIAVAVAHVTQCQYCIEGHTKLALKQGASMDELMEAIWVAAEMRAGAAVSHSKIAIKTMKESLQKEKS